MTGKTWRCRAPVVNPVVAGFYRCSSRVPVYIALFSSRTTTTQTPQQSHSACIGWSTGDRDRADVCINTCTQRPHGILNTTWNCTWSRYANSHSERVAFRSTLPANSHSSRTCYCGDRASSICCRAHRHGLFVSDSCSANSNVDVLVSQRVHERLWATSRPPCFHFVAFHRDSSATRVRADAIRT